MHVDFPIIESKISYFTSDPDLVQDPGEDLTLDPVVDSSLKVGEKRITNFFFKCTVQKRAAARKLSCHWS